MPLPSGLKETIVNFGTINQKYRSQFHIVIYKIKSMSSIHEAIKKYSSLMEQWEPCCNGTISLKKILEENVSRFSTFAQRKQRFIIIQPHAIKVHAAYFEAGADIVETNTFSGTTIGMADYH
jgi:5-methyltetrahydrofolate--homocysteine methyltransferase